MRRLLPVLLALIGLAAGAGAGFFLRPAPEPAEAVEEIAAAPAPGTPAEGRDYVRLNNQFVVPVVEDGKVSSMIILSLGLEVERGGNDTVYSREPRLRDALLRVLFDHANSGGFRGSFTDAATLALLRQALLEATQRVVGPGVSDVLITDIMRQDN